MTLLWTAQHGLVAIESDISKLVNLRALTVETNNTLISVSESISCLQRLEDLHIIGSALTTLPGGLAQLASLTELHIDGAAHPHGLRIDSSLEVSDLAYCRPSSLSSRTLTKGR